MIFLVGNTFALSTTIVKGTGIPSLLVLCQNNACAAHTYFSTSKINFSYLYNTGIIFVLVSPKGEQVY